MKRVMALGVVILLVMLVSFAGADNSTGETPVVVFIGTNQYQAVNRAAADAYGVTLVEYNLDAHRNLEKQFSKDLPQDLAEAERLANARLAALDKKVLQRAFQGIGLAIQWDIHKAPAFVFDDGESVIYGVTDTQVALKRWDYHRMTR